MLPGLFVLALHVLSIQASLAGVGIFGRWHLTDQPPQLRNRFRIAQDRHSVNPQSCQL